MAVTLRKPQPAPSSATDRLAAAQAALEEANRKLAELNEQRNAALLKDDDQEAIRLGSEIDALQQAAKAHEDKVRLLREAVAEEERERRVRERKGLIKRIQDKLDRRLALARRYEVLEQERGRLWAELHEVAAGITAAWPGGGTVPAGCLLDKTSLRVQWETEAARLNSNPDRLGGMGLLHPDRPATIPGARAGDLRLIWQPERLQSFVDAVAQANAFLLSTLDDSAPTIPTVNGANALAVDAAPRSEAEQELAGLLKRQAELAEDPSRESEYHDVVRKIVEAQAALTTEQQVGRQNV
jgi:hypothetical protein